jgi:hypothetical protein
VPISFLDKNLKPIGACAGLQHSQPFLARASYPSHLLFLRAHLRIAG